MLNVTFEFYKDEYGGKLNEFNFKQQLRKSIADFNMFTFNRVDVTNYEDEDVEMFKMAICELIDYNKQTSGMNAGLVSHASDGVTSVTFRVGSGGAEGSKSANDIMLLEKVDILRRWLSKHMNLLHRGLV
jgi:hypothetical protein